MDKKGMTVRPSTPADLDTLMDIYARARRFMQAHGNPTQWTGGYPSAELIGREIEEGHSFVLVDEEDGTLCGTFCFIPGEDPTYARIDDGAWPDDAPYAVIHRLAASGSRKGVADACLRWCAARADRLRVDTHRDNRVMQAVLARHGFRRCGIIRTRDGTPRIAYQLTAGD